MKVLSPVTFLQISICLSVLIPVESFQVHSWRQTRPSPAALFSELASLRVSEIKTELNDRGVDYSDCFDKESLLVKLKCARESGDAAQTVTACPVEPMQCARESGTADSAADSPPQSEPTIRESSSSDLFQDLGKKSVKELRQELASRNLRWAGMLEKKELVQAVFDAMQADALFSATGLMTPGKACEMAEGDLRKEIQATDKVTLLLDVHAESWCNPCRQMATQLEQAASELGSAVRVAKLDSDANQKLAGELRVQGLPTLILFENGKEVKRMEGAMMKDQLMEWIVEE